MVKFKRTILSIIAVCLVLLLSPAVQARSQSAFMKSGVGARARALGGVYEASVDNPTALYWNPAGLARIYGQEEVRKKKKRKKKKKEELQKAKKEEGGKKTDAQKLLESLENLESDIPTLQQEADIDKSRTYRTFGAQFNASYTYVTPERPLYYGAAGIYAWGGTFGVGLLHARQDDIQGADSSGNYTGKFNYSGSAVYLGYGREFGNVRVGFNMKGVQEQIDTSSLNGGGLDAGLQTDLFGSFIRIGLMVQDLVSVVPNSERDRTEFVDRVLGLAFTINPPTANNIYFVIGTKKNLSADEASSFGIGLKYEIGVFNVNIGFNDVGPSGGFGLDFRYFDFDVAISQDNLDQEFITTVELNATI